MIEYNVTMTRPDLTEAVSRKLFLDRPAIVRSARQLAGFLTHRLFGDYERGGAGTFYTVTVRLGGRLEVYTVRRMEDGTYQFVRP